MRHRSIFASLALTLALSPSLSLAQEQHFSLETTTGLRLHNVLAQPTTHDGKKGVRLIVDTAATRQLMAPGQPAGVLIAQIDGVAFSSGTIEIELAGTPAPGADTSARGFVGIAFRTHGDGPAYDAFYLRPTNGRATDQLRRNHAAQYIADPDWPWYRLRQETPGKYESYVDLVPDAWTKVRIEVHGARALLYVGDSPQPTLVVNDVKSGAAATGGVALWIGPGTIGYFRNLVVTPKAR